MSSSPASTQWIALLSTNHCNEQYHFSSKSPTFTKHPPVGSTTLMENTDLYPADFNCKYHSGEQQSDRHEIVSGEKCQNTTSTLHDLKEVHFVLPAKKKQQETPYSVPKCHLGEIFEKLGICT